MPDSEVNAALSKLLTDGSNSLQDIIIQAFNAGLEMGRDQMRTAILNAARGPIPTASSFAISMATDVQGAGRSSRAPHGSVRNAVIKALQKHPAEGLLESDVGICASQIDATISPRSVGAELRRMRGRLYNSQHGSWFLIPQDREKETAESALTPSAVSSTSATEEEDRAPDTAIVT